jgi:hypothetical protein
MTNLKTAAAAFGLSAAVLAAAAVPASAAPVASNSVVLKAAVADDIVTVAAKGKRRGGPAPYYYYDDFNTWFGGPDTVGSVGYDGRYYAYNRFSGQRYSSCVEDLGYGRVRPCDAGRR